MQDLIPVKMDSYLLLRSAYNLLYLGKEIIFVAMNKLALEPSETLETSSYIVGGVEPPAVQGFMIPMNCLGGNWRVCEPGLNP